MSALLFLAALALQPAPETDAAPAEPSKADKIVCTRRPPPSIGSNISPGRICRRQSELDEEARVARRGIQKNQDRRNDPAFPRNAIQPPQ